MSIGVDTSSNVIQSTTVEQFFQSLKQKQCSFIGRYYNVDDPSKNLTAIEAAAIVNAGLRIVAIWENGDADTTPVNQLFNYNQGFSDGSIACYYAGYIIGQPCYAPIYFSVDYDYSEEDIKNYVIPYFKGVNEAFLTFGDGTLQYPVGVYGSKLTCYLVFEAKLASYSYKSCSDGWRVPTPPVQFNFNIEQSIGKIIDEIAVDFDVSFGNNEGSFLP